MKDREVMVFLGGVKSMRHFQARDRAGSTGLGTGLAVRRLVLVAFLRTASQMSAHSPQTSVAHTHTKKKKKKKAAGKAAIAAAAN
ncbi:hypothetical protein [Variovorax durovernensis]